MAESNVNRSKIIDVADEYCSKKDDSGRYKFDWCEFNKPGPKKLIKLWWEGSTARIPEKAVLDEQLPVIKPNFLDRPSDGIHVTWLGHACVLVQMDNTRILTDPIFSSKCGPTLGFQFGLTRYRDAPCRVDELPKIDAVVISHNHYDHLDYPTVCELNRRFPELTWYVPNGLKDWMKGTGCKNVEELDWWEMFEKNGVKFVFVPSQHWSKRHLNDDNMTLWGGWCIQGQTHRFYFAGDTGYSEGLFKEIGAKLGPFDLAAIPIGSYEPGWFMGCQHINPEEAWKIHGDVRAKKSIGIHWGTFNLSREDYLDPRKKIKELQASAQNTEENDFFTLNPGGTKFLQDSP